MITITKKSNYVEFVLNGNVFTHTIEPVLISQGAEVNSLKIETASGLLNLEFSRADLTLINGVAPPADLTTLIELLNTDVFALPSSGSGGGSADFTETNSRLGAKGELPATSSTGTFSLNQIQKYIAVLLEKFKFGNNTKDNSLSVTPATDSSFAVTGSFYPQTQPVSVTQLPAQLNADGGVNIHVLNANTDPATGTKQDALIAGIAKRKFSYTPSAKVTVNAANTSEQLAAANANGYDFLLTNNGTTVIYYALGENAGVNTIPLQPGQSVDTEGKGVVQQLAVYGPVNSLFKLYTY